MRQLLSITSNFLCFKGQIEVIWCPISYEAYIIYNYLYTTEVSLYLLFSLIQAVVWS